MKITVRVIVEPGDGAPATSHDVAVLARDDLTAVTAGLRLDEAHQMLSGVQEHLVTAQADAAVAHAETCGDCGRRLAHKDSRYIVLRSLFGTLRLASPRFKTCPCRASTAATFSPLAELLPERTTPELAYWEAKYATLASYSGAATLLTETFPLGRILEATALRRRTARTAQRLEDGLGAERASFIDTCPAEWAQLPRPDLPLVVGLDGGYVPSKGVRCGVWCRRVHRPDRAVRDVRPRRRGPAGPGAADPAVGARLWTDADDLTDVRYL